MAVAAAGLATAVWLPARFDQASATETPQLEQIFSDDFDGARGDSVDQDKWSTDGRSVRLDGEGNLLISPRTGERSRSGEAGLQTTKAFESPAGAVEARAKVADGASVRSVFRLLGADTPDLDVMKNSGDKSRVLRAALGADVDGRLEAEQSFAEDFHTYAVRWEPGLIVWTVDGKEFLRTEKDLADPFAVALQVSAESERSRNDRSDRRMLVDFVRVSTEEASPPEEKEPPSEAPPTEAPPPAAEAWAPFTLLIAGDVVTFDGLTYEVKATHTSLPGWEPPALQALFKLL